MNLSTVRVTKSIKKNLGDYNSAGAEISLEYVLQEDERLTEAQLIDEVFQTINERLAKELNLSPSNIGDVSKGTVPAEPAKAKAKKAEPKKAEASAAADLDDVLGGGKEPATVDAKDVIAEVAKEVETETEEEPMSNSDFNMALANNVKAFGAQKIKDTMSVFGAKNAAEIDKGQRRAFIEAISND